MLENPENKVWLDTDTIVATSDRQAAIRRYRELAEYNVSISQSISSLNQIFGLFSPI